MSSLRPRLHHTPVNGWVNDPLALTWHGGRYHLFFQYVPDSTVWDVACRWGHATLTDLLSWQPAPVALEPGDGEDGVWSGSLALDGDAAVVFYTAVDTELRERGRVRRAVPLDADWEAWRKEAVVVAPPEAALAFRDPFVHRDGAGWRMLVAGALTTGEGALWVATSSDLAAWSAPVVAASGAEIGAVWECPALLAVGGRSLLVVSGGGLGEPMATYAAWCEDHGDRLELGAWQQLTHGRSLYAASGFVDADGEPGVIAWLREVGDVAAGWMGAHSLPYRLRADGDVVAADPHPGLLDRRVGVVTDGLLPATADLEWAARPGDVLAAVGRFRLDAVGDAVVVTVGEVRETLPWGGGPLRAVLDGPVLEVFGDRGVLAVPVPATGRDGVLEGALERVRVFRLS